MRQVLQVDAVFCIQHDEGANLQRPSPGSGMPSVLYVLSFNMLPSLLFYHLSAWWKVLSIFCNGQLQHAYLLNPC